MAWCLATLSHNSHLRLGQYCACDSKACPRQAAEACSGGWQCSRIAPGVAFDFLLAAHGLLVSVAGSIGIMSKAEFGMLLKVAEEELMAR